MSPADPADPPLLSLLNIALFVWGAVIWWRFQFVKSTAHFRVKRLADTRVSLPDFLFQGILVIAGAVAGGAIANATAVLLPVALKTDKSFLPFWVGAGVDGGALLLLWSGKRMPAWLKPQRDFAIEAVPTEPTAPLLPTRQIPQAGLFTFLAALPAVIVVQQSWFFLLEKLHIDAPHQPLIDLVKGPHATALVVIFSLLTIVLGPILEELIFRAGIFRYSRQVMPRWAAFLVSAVVFGAVHANLSSFIPLTVFAYVLALSYERTGRIAVPMIAHALFNLTSLILLFSGMDS